ncbi:hypothetical protein EYC84_002876 [Monilinia fructicola]|uniref:Uncharacterized protein n=1 Tax=Monilinia fructicola TaxID=38448 RepID=A0A5M9JUF5_MONFR|nr:hypothetical protein EYC84_002876 [Monilinia fructicola]
MQSHFSPSKKLRKRKRDERNHKQARVREKAEQIASAEPSRVVKDCPIRKYKGAMRDSQCTNKSKCVKIYPRERFCRVQIDEDGELCTTNHQYKQTNALLLHLRKVHKEEVHFHSVQGVPNTAMKNAAYKHFKAVYAYIQQNTKEKDKNIETNDSINESSKNSLHSKSSKRKPPTRHKLNKSRQQQHAESPILSSGDQTQESGPSEPEIPASPQDNIPIPLEIDSESTSKRSENVLTSQPTDPSTTTTSSTLIPHSTIQLSQSAPNPISKTLEKQKK